MAERKSKQKARSESKVRKLLVDSAFAGLLLSVSLMVSFFTHFLDLVRELYPAPKSMITVGPGSPMPYLDSATSFFNSKPLTIALFVLATYVFIINLVDLIRKYFVKRPARGN